MKLLNLTPFEVVPLPGRIFWPGHSLTLIVKGTFDLVPGADATVADEPLPITGDEPYPDDEEGTGSPRYESDLAYFKQAADLLLVGKCHTPNKSPMPMCNVTFRVGSRSRTLSVFGDRCWERGLLKSSSSQAVPFTEMDLRYENSFGGEGDKRNPVGKGNGKIVDESGRKTQLLPNIEDPANLIDSARSRPEPAGFGPLHRAWEHRSSRIGTYGKQWFKQRSPWLPEDMDPTVFNAAAPQMRVEGYLRGDEEVLLENLHPKHAQYRGRLPAMRVRCFLNEVVPAKDGQPGREMFSEVAMNLDTLWIDAGAEQLVLVWRGAAKVLSNEYEEMQDLLVMSEPVADSPASVEQCRRMLLEAPSPDEDAPEDVEPEPEPAQEPPPEDDDSEFEAETEAKTEQDLQRIKAELLTHGYDLDNPPPPTEQEKAELAKIEAELDEEEDEEPEPEPEEEQASEPSTLTRELVQTRLAAGESLADENLSGLDLSGLPMQGANLAGADLSGAILAGSVLDGADMTGCVLTEADFRGASLKNVIMNEAVAVAVNMDEADLEGALAGSGADFSQATFRNASGPGSIWSEAILTGADFSHATMEEANFAKASMEGANLHAANMKLGIFYKANLRKARLDEMNLFKGNMQYADLTGADLSGSNMYGVEFADAVIDGAKAKGTNFAGTRYAD